MGTPQVVQGVKNRVVDGVIIMINNELAYIICCAVQISWNPLHINAYTVKTLLQTRNPFVGGGNTRSGRVDDGPQPRNNLDRFPNAFGVVRKKT